MEPSEALKEVARRYLRAFGPATMENFAEWWSIRLTPAKKLFQSLADELEEVEVEGWRALALREALESMQSLEHAGVVRLLPLFDAYVMGIGRGADIEPLLPRAFQKLVYRPQGWITAVVLEDGFLKGIWDYQTQRSRITIRVSLFSSPTPSIREGIEAEAERLSAFLNTRAVIEYSDSL